MSKAQGAEAFPKYLFHQGKNYNAYRFLGAHPDPARPSAAVFRVWAPRAEKVSLVGEFNGWDVGTSPMHKMEEDSSIWEIVQEGVSMDALYKFAITTDTGKVLYKSDPFAFMSEPPLRDGKITSMASQYHPPDDNFHWRDHDWLERRQKKNPYTSPMNIYEVHLGSWQKKEDGGLYNYRELAHLLIPYVKKMGYTHLEIMPLMEHPFDGSWGYQVCGYYSVTSRYGTPEDFKYFVDYAHRNNIGVIMDWVPAHFPKDAHGLYEFDGYPLYEDGDVLRMEHKTWGTRIFDYGRPEVLSFLISNAFFFLEQYHVDALRVDAVAAMLYLDYDRKAGEWRPNIRGGRENLEAVHFLKTLNKEVLTAFPGVLMIAEESTSWPLVTKPPEVDGLGFNFKWNMGWMNDVLSYFSADPLFRSGLHDRLTFPMVYAFSENYILPISHDEVVHGKRSLLDKMPGTYEDKFAGQRLFLIHMLTQPGKKLVFMGSELGQFTEWDEKKELDWVLLDYEKHRKLQRFFREANQLYLSCSALWKCDDSWDGFQWVDAGNADDNVLSFLRMDITKGEEQRLLIIENLSGSLYKVYRVGVPEDVPYLCLLDSDQVRFGGSGSRRKKKYIPRKGEWNGFPQFIEIKLPPLSAIILKEEEGKK